MSPLPAALRRSPSALLLGSLACCAAGGVVARQAHAEQFSWSVVNGLWLTPGNWTPAGIPGTGAATDATISIGNLPGIQNGTILLNSPPFWGAVGFGSLSLASGMTLDLNGSELGSLQGTLSLTGMGTTLVVRPSAGPNFHDLTAYDLLLGDGTLVSIVDAGRIRVGVIDSSGVLTGRGTVHIQGDGAVSLRNDGTIGGTGNGGLTLLQEGPGRFDLDGSTGDGMLALTAPFSQLSVTGDGLADSFSGSLSMSSGSLLTMDLADGWTADANATISASSSIVGGAVQMAGSPWSLAGELTVSGSQGHLRVLSDLTVKPGATLSLGTADVLELDGTTSLEGGTFTLGAGARVEFDGPATIEGGTVQLSGATLADGAVLFEGPTTWDGGITVNGVARQMATATVVGPTVIDATVFDMDGETGYGLWTIEDALTIDAAAIDISAAEEPWIGSTIVVGGSITAALHMQLAAPQTRWHSGGSVVLRGIGALPVTRLGGTPVGFHTFLTVADGLVQITADTVIDGAAVTIEDDSTLRLRASSVITAESSFHDAGMLTNGVNGAMALADGVDLDQVGLTNTAWLAIGESAEGDQGVGGAIADRFTQTGAGTWRVDIGGTAPVTEHDRLDVTGNVSLAGTLLVELVDGFVPAPGDGFTILTWTGTRTGTFASVIGCYGARVHYEAQYAWVEFGGKGGLTGDLNSDDRVDALDVALLLGSWGLCPAACCNADLDGDGAIDANDLAMLLGQWTA